MQLASLHEPPKGEPEISDLHQNVDTSTKRPLTNLSVNLNDLQLSSTDCTSFASASSGSPAVLLCSFVRYVAKPGLLWLSRTQRRKEPQPNDVSLVMIARKSPESVESTSQPAGTSTTWPVISRPTRSSFDAAGGNTEKLRCPSRSENRLGSPRSGGGVASLGRQPLRCEGKAKSRCAG